MSYNHYHGLPLHIPKKDPGRRPRPVRYWGSVRTCPVPSEASKQSLRRLHMIKGQWNVVGSMDYHSFNGLPVIPLVNVYTYLVAELWLLHRLVKVNAFDPRNNHMM